MKILWCGDGNPPRCGKENSTKSVEMKILQCGNENSKVWEEKFQSVEIKIPRCGGENFSVEMKILRGGDENSKVWEGKIPPFGKKIPQCGTGNPTECGDGNSKVWEGKFHDLGRKIPQSPGWKIMEIPESKTRKSWDAPGKRKLGIINPILRFLGEFMEKKINFIPLKVKNSLVFYEKKKKNFTSFLPPSFWVISDTNQHQETQKNPKVAWEGRAELLTWAHTRTGSIWDAFFGVVSFFFIFLPWFPLVFLRNSVTGAARQSSGKKGNGGDVGRGGFPGIIGSAGSEFHQILKNPHPKSSKTFPTPRCFPPGKILLFCFQIGDSRRKILKKIDIPKKLERNPRPKSIKTSGSFPKNPAAHSPWKIPFFFFCFPSLGIRANSNNKFKIGMEKKEKSPGFDPFSTANPARMRFEEKSSDSWSSGHEKTQEEILGRILGFGWI